MENECLCNKILTKLTQLSLYKFCIIFTIFYALIINMFLENPEEIVEGKFITVIKNIASSKISEIKQNFTNPAIVWWTQESDIRPHTVACGAWSCDVFSGKITLPNNDTGVYLFHGSRIDFDELPTPRDPIRKIWALLLAESPRNAQNLMHKQLLSLFNFSSTFSRHSDVPFPLQDMLSLENITNKKYFVRTSIKNRLLTKISPIVYLQSVCDTSTERDEYVMKLMKFQRVDSYGRCLNNKRLPRHIKNHNYIYMDRYEEEEMLRLLAKYKFIIAIENAVCDDYVTEKFWRAIHLGVVPIYFGSPTIRDWLPNPRAAILISDFKSPKMLSKHIEKLMNDDDLYEEYLEHKTKGKIANQNLIKEIKQRPYQSDDNARDSEYVCFLCEKLHHKKLHLTEGWNIVKTSHFNCPKPVSALTQMVNDNSTWAKNWESFKVEADLVKNIMMI